MNEYSLTPVQEVDGLHIKWTTFMPRLAPER